MKEKPILFSGPMVRAILDGTKTQTRRPVRDEIIEDAPGYYRPTAIEYPYWAWNSEAGPRPDMRCAYAADRLWVREAWRAPVNLDGMSPKEIGAACLEAFEAPWCPIRYEADGVVDNWDPFMWPHETGRYRHARFMPRWLSRITLDVLSIRAERLHDISDEDIVAEGVTVDVVERMTGVRVPHLRDAWRLGWKHIYGAESWNANPWLWVIEFRRSEVTR